MQTPSELYSVMDPLSAKRKNGELQKWSPTIETSNGKLNRFKSHSSDDDDLLDAKIKQMKKSKTGKKQDKGGRFDGRRDSMAKVKAKNRQGKNQKPKRKFTVTEDNISSEFFEGEGNVDVDISVEEATPPTDDEEDKDQDTDNDENDDDGPNKARRSSFSRMMRPISPARGYYRKLMDDDEPRTYTSIIAPQTKRVSFSTDVDVSNGASTTVSHAHGRRTKGRRSSLSSLSPLRQRRHRLQAQTQSLSPLRHRRLQRILIADTVHNNSDALDNDEELQDQVQVSEALLPASGQTAGSMVEPLIPNHESSTTASNTAGTTVSNDTDQDEASTIAPSTIDDTPSGWWSISSPIPKAYKGKVTLSSNERNSSSLKSPSLKEWIPTHNISADKTSLREAVAAKRADDVSNDVSTTSSSSSSLLASLQQRVSRIARCSQKGPNSSLWSHEGNPPNKPRVQAQQIMSSEVSSTAPTTPMSVVRNSPDLSAPKSPAHPKRSARSSTLIEGGKPERDFERAARTAPASPLTPRRRRFTSMQEEESPTTTTLTPNSRRAKKALPASSPTQQENKATMTRSADEARMKPSPVSSLSSLSPQRSTMTESSQASRGASGSAPTSPQTMSTASQSPATTVSSTGDSTMVLSDLLPPPPFFTTYDSATNTTTEEHANTASTPPTAAAPLTKNPRRRLSRVGESPKAVSSLVSKKQHVLTPAHTSAKVRNTTSLGGNASLPAESSMSELALLGPGRWIEDSTAIPRSSSSRSMTSAASAPLPHRKSPQAKKTTMNKKDRKHRSAADDLSPSSSHSQPAARLSSKVKANNSDLVVGLSFSCHTPRVTDTVKTSPAKRRQSSNKKKNAVEAVAAAVVSNSRRSSCPSSSRKKLELLQANAAASASTLQRRLSAPSPTFARSSPNKNKRTSASTTGKATTTNRGTLSSSSWHVTQQGGSVLPGRTLASSHHSPPETMPSRRHTKNRVASPLKAPSSRRSSCPSTSSSRRESPVAPSSSPSQRRRSAPSRAARGGGKEIPHSAASPASSTEGTATDMDSSSCHVPRLRSSAAKAASVMPEQGLSASCHTPRVTQREAPATPRNMKNRFRESLKSPSLLRRSATCKGDNGRSPGHKKSGCSTKTNGLPSKNDTIVKKQEKTAAMMTTKQTPDDKKKKRTGASAAASPTSKPAASSFLESKLTKKGPHLTASMPGVTIIPRR